MGQKMKKIGWIGTGVMGHSMLKHLLNDGYSCSVYNRTRSKAKDLIKAGATWLGKPAEIAAHSDIVFTIVGYPADVEEVYFGENGIFTGVKKGAILVDMTTTKPMLAKKIAQAAGEKKCQAIDAPVSGGDVGAREGKLSIMVGGKKTAVEEIMPLLQLMGGNIIYQGPAGSGQHTKMCNQVTIAGTMIGVCESLVYGAKAGLNLETMLKSITKGAAGCWTLDKLAPRIVKNDMEPGFYVEHFIKDMGIALEEAERMGLSLPGLALAKQLYLSVKALGMGKKGTQALVKAIENLAGIPK